MRRGDRVTVLTPHARGVALKWRDDGVRVVSFRYAPEPFEAIGYSRSLEADETLRAGSALVAPFYAVGAALAIRREMRKRRFDLLHAHWVVPNGLIAARFARRVPLAVGLHGSDVFLAEKPGVRRLVADTLRRTSVMTGCSPELVDRVCALGFDSAYAHVIPYGVDTRLFSPMLDRRAIWRQQLGIPADAWVVLSVGRMATKKGYQVLIEGLGDLLETEKNLHLVLAGAGDRLEEFRRKTEPWRARVHLPGAVLRDTLPDLYRAADAFVLPAVHDQKGNVDGLPNVILEAMASGLPVVASGISGIPLAITEGIHGHLVPEGQPEPLIAALRRLAHDPKKAQEMGREGRRRAEAELTWDAVAARYRQAYELVLAAH